VCVHDIVVAVIGSAIISGIVIPIVVFLQIKRHVREAVRVEAEIVSDRALGQVKEIMESYRDAISAKSALRAQAAHLAVMPKGMLRAVKTNVS
jgi:hypothetical protein